MSAPWAISVLGVRLAQGLVGEVVGEHAVPGEAALSPVGSGDPTQDGHVAVVELVEVADAGHEPVHVDGHRRDVLTTERAHDAGLAHGCGQVTAHEGVLVGLVEQAQHVAHRRRVGVVDDGELLGRVRLGRGLGGVRHVEADSDDDAAVLTDERVQVGGVVAGRRGPEVAVGQAGDGRRRHLEAGVSRGVERPVVDTAGVCDLAGLEARSGARGQPGRPIAGRGTGGDADAGDHGGRRQHRRRRVPAAAPRLGGLVKVFHHHWLLLFRVR